jgi:LuxR family maltose regulon positive regulatory protein
VYLAQGDIPAALALLTTTRAEMAAKEWADQYLKAVTLLALAHHLAGNRTEAETWLVEALTLAIPGGFIRLFVDEGRPMADLITLVAAGGILPDYTARLLAAFAAELPPPDPTPSTPLTPVAQPLIEPLSERELEILHLIAEGLSNRDIGQRLFLALSTVKGHNRNIFDKLQVQRRTEAVARARELGLL